MGKKVLILSNHFITLYNFRRELLARLIECGYEVIISTPKDENNTYFESMGCRIIETNVDRRGINPFKDTKLILSYINIMRRVKPDIVFSYTIKPNIYGSIASNLTGCKQVCNITGTGATFIKQNFVSAIAKLLYRISIKKAYKVLFQNSGGPRFLYREQDG